MLVDGNIADDDVVVVIDVVAAAEAAEENIDKERVGGGDEDSVEEEEDTALVSLAGELLLDVREAAVEDTIRLVAAVVQVNALELELMVMEGTVKPNVVWVVSSRLSTTFFSESISAPGTFFSVAIRSSIFSTRSCSALRSFS